MLTPWHSACCSLSVCKPKVPIEGDTAACASVPVNVQACYPFEPHEDVTLASVAIPSLFCLLGVEYIDFYAFASADCSWTCALRPPP